MTVFRIRLRYLRALTATGLLLLMLPETVAMSAGTCWAKAFGSIPSSNSSGRDAFASVSENPADGSLLYVGTSNGGSDLTDPMDAWIVRTDRAGRLISSNALGSPTTYEFLLVAKKVKQNGYILGGARTRPGAQNPGELAPWLVKLADDGSIEWERIYPGTYPANGRIHSVKETFTSAGIQDGYIVGGWGQGIQHDAFVLRVGMQGQLDGVDGEGAPFWKKYIRTETWQTLDPNHKDIQETESYDEVWDVRQTRDTSSFVGVGRTGSSATSDPFMFKLRRNGLVEWNWTYERYDPHSDNPWRVLERFELGRWMDETTDLTRAGTGFVLTGPVSTGWQQDLFVMRTNSGGVPIWQYAYDLGSNEDSFHIHALHAPGATDGVGNGLDGFIVGGSSGTTQLDGFLLKLDADGGSEWAKTYGGPTHNDVVSQVHPSHDSGDQHPFVVSGHSRTPSQDGWGFRTQSDGSLDGLDPSFTVTGKTAVRGVLAFTTSLGPFIVDNEFVRAEVPPPIAVGQTRVTELVQAQC